MEGSGRCSPLLRGESLTDAEPREREFHGGHRRAEPPWLFTVEAAKRSSGTVYALDIEPLMLAATTEVARNAGVANVQPIECDFVIDDTGLPSQSCDYAMVFNLLHIDEPVALLRKAYRVLQPGGKLGIIHWNVDPTTPRGPSMAIRPTPEQCRRWTEDAGFGFVREEPGIAKWHWGLLMQRP